MNGNIFHRNGDYMKIPKLYILIGIAFINLVSLFVLFSYDVMLMAIGLIITAITGGFVIGGHILTPLLTKMLKVTYNKGEYIIPPGQEVIIRRSGNKYLACKYLLLNIQEREEISKMEEHSITYVQDIENALGTITVPTKINILISNKEVGGFRDETQSKVYELSLKIKREMEKGEPDVIKIDKWQKEKERQENLLKRLAGGVKPINTICYVSTLGRGITIDEAIDKANAQTREIKAVLSNSMNSEIIDLIGEDMELCFNLDFFPPYDNDDLKEMVG
jgi:hypothetical protein